MRIRPETSSTGSSVGRRGGRWAPTPLVTLATTTILVGTISAYASRHWLPADPKAALYHYAERRGFAAFDDEVRLRQAGSRLPAYLSRVLRTNDLPTIAMDIKFLDMQKLEAKRREAFAAGRLTAGSDDFVPASIRSATGTLKARVRLKGDYLDHLEGQKWSMRVHLSGDDHLFGLRRFSLQHPVTRGFQAEALFRKSLRDEGVLTPTYSFVNLVVNGTDRGIMALEEHFAKELLERNGRKDSVIIKLDESLFWSSKSFEKETPFLVSPFLLYQNATVEAFESSRVRKSQSLRSDFEVAAGLLRAFAEGALPASEVFDVQQLGRYLGVTEFWGGWHEIRWNNQRFYYNPFTMRLEPVAFDGSLQYRLPLDRGIVGAPLVKRMLDDPEVYAVYERTLRRMAEKTLHGSLLRELEEFERPILEALQSEYFLLESFDFAELRERATTTAKRAGANGWIQPHGDFEEIPIFAHAYLVNGAAGPYLELLNVLPLEVQVRAIDSVDADGRHHGFSPASPVSYPFTLPPTPIGDSPESVVIPCVGGLPEGQRLTVTFALPGYDKAEELREYTVKPMPEPLRGNPLPTSTIEEQLRRHPFLSVDDDGTSVVVAPGTWQVRGCIILPRGYTLIVRAGTRLRFEESGCLVAFGPTLLEGHPDSRVVLEGAPTKDGRTGTWQGIAVQSAPSRSRWTNVEVRNTSGVHRGAWRLTGGTTFYRSDVDIADATFTGHTGEDALNIIHADYTITDTEISDTASDGFDGDFTTGTIRGGSFRDIGTKGGGDAVDISGSQLSIEDTGFTRVNDKAISVGEASRLVAQNVAIEDCGVGVASKDGSEVTIHESTIRSAVHAGLMAYAKKTEYGATRLDAEGVDVLECRTSALSQTGSTLLLNGDRIPTQPLDVDLLYATVMKPGVAR